MRRESNAPRADDRAIVERQGLVWHTARDGMPYWTEGAHYRLTSAEIVTLKAATAELYRLFLAAGQHVLDRDLLAQFGIPVLCHQAIRDAWDAEPPALNYGRFDLGFDGGGPPKLFEFNCDTPTSLLEAAIIQWEWKAALFPASDQFNSLHERLVAQWADIRHATGADGLHFVYAPDVAGEDAVTVAYLRDTARQAGLASRSIAMRDIGWDSAGRRFVDLDNVEMPIVYHLYPWEWLTREAFGPQLIESLPQTLWIEPIWKMLWSNKAILAVLWELYPDHPNLLRADVAPIGSSFVRKPFLSREGAGVTVVRDGTVIAGSGAADGDCIFQDLYPLPDFAGRYPVIGSWIVDGAAAGIGIREGGLVTDNTAAFVPHIIAD